jgi:hypothetical protein
LLAVTKTRSDVPVFLLYAGIIHAIALALLLPMIVTLPGPGGETAPARAPASAPAPEISPIDVIVLPPPQPLTDVGPEEMSALPSAPRKSAATAPTAAPVVNEPEPEQETKAQESNDDGAAPAPAIEPQGQVTPPQTEPAKIEALTPEAPAKAGVEAAPLPDGTVPPPAVEPEPDQAPQKAEPSKEGASAQDAVPAKASTKADKAVPAKAAPPRTAKKPIAQRSRTSKPAPSRTASRAAKSQAQFAPFNGMLSGLLSPAANKRR